MRISAVILAGGRGERLFPLTNTRPKPLCPVGGVYPLERAITLARGAGAAEIIVTASYLAEDIEGYVRGMEGVSVLREEHPLSTAGAVKNACPSGELVIVLCGDTICSFSLLDAVKYQKNGDADITVVTTRTKGPTDYGVVCTSGGYITSFTEKPSWAGVESDEINTGIYILRRRVLDLVPSATPYDFGSQLLPRMLSEGRKIGAYHADGYWCDMGTPRSYFEANLAASGGGSVIDGSCVLHEKSAVVRSVLLENVYLGRGSVIKQSIVCENVKIGRGCVIEPGCIIGGSCVIEDGCRLEGGVILTNGVVLGKDTHVMKNIFSREFKTRLFDSDLGVGGVYGSGFDISDAVSLGEGLCALKGGGARVGVMSGEGSFSRILAGVITGGVRFGGGSELDLGRGFLAECGWAARHYKLDYALFVDVDDGFGISISVFDGSGLFLSREEQRRLERLFFRRSRAARPQASDDRETQTANAEGEYKAALKELAGSLDGLAATVRGGGRAEGTLREALTAAGCRVLNDGAEGGDIWTISPDGRRVEVQTADGKSASYWHLWTAAMAEAVKNGMKKVYMPVFSPVTAAEYLGGLGATVVYYSDSEADERSGAGAQQVQADGCRLAVRVLRLLAEEKLTLSQLLARLPAFYVREVSVPVSEDEKAERIRALREECDDRRRCSAFVFGSGRVSVMASNGAFLKLFAEAVSSEAAEEIALEVRKKIGDKQNEADK